MAENPLNLIKDKIYCAKLENEEVIIRYNKHSDRGRHFFCCLCSTKHNRFYINAYIKDYKLISARAATEEEETLLIKQEINHIMGFNNNNKLI